MFSTTSTPGAPSRPPHAGQRYRAAEQLRHRTLQVLSPRLGMEREMGFAFFDKNTRPYRPTPQLRAFLAAFEPALRNLENARALHQATGEKMRIRFAAPIEISRLYFSKALVSLCTGAPEPLVRAPARGDARRASRRRRRRDRSERRARRRRGSRRSPLPRHLHLRPRDARIPEATRHAANTRRPCAPHGTACFAPSTSIP